MAKRFTDTQIWEKEWFMALSPKLKCLWRYLTERCDQSGVWEPNWTLASLYIGEPVVMSDLKKFGSHVESLPNGKIFIPDFINFQYGALSEKSPAHKPVFRAISKNNLNNRVFNRVSNTLQEKEKEKEEEGEAEKEKEGHENKTLKTEKIEVVLAGLDDIYLDGERPKWKHIDFDFELQTFREKVRGSPQEYENRDTPGIRLAFQYQLRNAKKPHNGNGNNTKGSTRRSDAIVGEKQYKSTWD